MKSYPHFRKAGRALGKAVWLAFFVTIAGLPVAPRIGAAPNVALWDTVQPLTETAGIEERTGWKAVPNDLLTLEADPPKARSDPGYYGREYTFKGDAVVENDHVTGVFLSAKGRVVIYAKDDGSRLGRKVAELAPLQTKALPATMSHFSVLRNGEDEVALEVSFSAKGIPDLLGVFAFDKTEILEVKPSETMKGVRLLSNLEYGVVPSFVGDDLIFGAATYPSADTLCIPSENVLLGLREGGDSELVMSWPKGKQQVKFRLGDSQGKRLIESIDFDNDGQSFYLAALSAPGLWHKEALTASYLEKDVAVPWKRPFPAKWKTQLYEEGTRTTFVFKPAKGQVWRGVPGSYSYPVWFNGDEAFYRLSKKVPPKGESLIYFLEGQETPASVTTPVDIMKATLGRATCDSILDVAGRKLRTHHRRGGDGVHRACTCGCTEAIQAFFEAREEVAQKEAIRADLEDMVYFVHRHVERIEEYRKFADDTIKFLHGKAGASAELKPYLEGLEQIAGEIPQQYEVQKENMKSFAHADDLAQQTLALCSKTDTNNLKSYMDLLKAWRAMGGAQDYVLAQCHTITRRLCQEAGYACVDQPKAAALAEEIRARCRRCLRNPDGYEIWADY